MKQIDLEPSKYRRLSEPEQKRRRDIAMLISSGCGVWAVAMFLVGGIYVPHDLRWYVSLAAFGPPALLGILMVALD